MQSRRKGCDFNQACKNVRLKVKVEIHTHGVDQVFPGSSIISLVCMRGSTDSVCTLPAVYISVINRYLDREVNCGKPTVTHRFSHYKIFHYVELFRGDFTLRGPGSIISSISESCSFTVKDTVIEMYSSCPSPHLFLSSCYIYLSLLT